jgi:hypothetical protein
MTRINDFHLFAGGYVIVTLVGISRRPRCRGSIGAIRRKVGVRRRWDDGFGLQAVMDVIPSPCETRV